MNTVEWLPCRYFKFHKNTKSLEVAHVLIVYYST